MPSLNHGSTAGKSMHLLYLCNSFTDLLPDTIKVIVNFYSL